MPTSTSPLGSALDVAGMLLQVGNGAASPEGFYFIANVDNVKFPSKSKVVEVTNVGDQFVRRRPTTLDSGIATGTCYFVPKELSHGNIAPSGSPATAGGLRWLWINRTLRDWQLVYPDSAILADCSVDTYTGYVTGIGIAGKQSDVFHGDFELSFDGAPTLA